MAGITPVSGYISGPWAAAVAFIIALSAFAGIWIIKGKLKIDDALDVSSVHGITGIIGSISIGFVASQDVNPAGPIGWFYGNFSQVYIQITAVALTIAWSGFWTSLLIICFRYSKFFKLTVEKEIEILGLDYYYHGDVAYSSLEAPEDPELEDPADNTVQGEGNGERERLNVNIQAVSNRDLTFLQVPVSARKTLSARHNIDTIHI